MIVLFLAFAGCTTDADGDGWAAVDDCADDDPTIFPGAREVCNARDDDCDGEVDETFDQDGDGALADTPDCALLGAELDCDDTDPAFHPGAEELCNGVDDDCSGTADDAPDADGDGFTVCKDCDDGDPFVYPGAVEACDGLDNDCSGAADEPWDEDGDGVSPCGGDCDDGDPDRAPGLDEVCDGKDDDCDGEVDEGFDADGDGFSTCRGDCDDADPDAFPGQAEVCDGADNDCDASTDEAADTDGDGYTLCTGDCDDTSAAAHPGGTESCDGVDDDCNGATDELPECFGCFDTTDWLVCLGYVDWDSAEAACEAFGSALVTIDDDTENTALSDLLGSYTGSSFWIGYNDQAEEGSFVWVDGSTSTYTHWNAGEPNDSGGEDCAADNYGALYGWNDFPCTTQSLPFVCD